MQSAVPGGTGRGGWLASQALKTCSPWWLRHASFWRQRTETTSDQQPVAQSHGPLPEVSPRARPAGAPPPPLAHPVPAQGASVRPGGAVILALPILGFRPGPSLFYSAHLFQVREVKTSSPEPPSHAQREMKPLRVRQRLPPRIALQHTPARGLASTAFLSAILHAFGADCGSCGLVLEASRSRTQMPSRAGFPISRQAPSHA